MLLIPILPHTMPAAYVLAQLFSCTPAASPSVVIEFKNAPYTINNNVTLAELQRVQSDTHIAKTPTENFTTVGTATSNIETNMAANFQLLKSPVTGRACISLSEVTVTLAYTPQILILRDYRPNSCRYRTTLEHEIRHVNTDILTLHEYTGIIRKNMHSVINTLPTRGPIDTSAINGQQADMQGKLEKTLKATTDQMATVRQARQQLVDTREEYMRLSAACPNEPVPTLPGGRR